MAQQSAGSNLFDPLGVWKQARDTNLDAWSKVMIDLVNSDAYAKASAQMLDQYLLASQPFQQTLATVMTSSLTALNLPSRAELASVAERLTNIEIRLDDLADQIRRSDARLGPVLDAIQVALTAPAAGRTEDKGEAQA